MSNSPEAKSNSQHTSTRSHASTYATAWSPIAQNNRAKLHHTLQYSSDNKAAMNTGGLYIVTTQHAYSAIMSNLH